MPFELIRAEELLATVAQRFAQAYGLFPPRIGPATIRWQHYEKLLALGPTPSVEGVAAVLGYEAEHWVHVPPCSTCDRRHAPWVLRVGQTPGHDRETAWLCPQCMGEAIELLITEDVSPCFAEAQTEGE